MGVRTYAVDLNLAFLENILISLYIYYNIYILYYIIS